ncbi:MAG TPA: chemotaxis response regulator protein-glutamate methylesterase [Anaerohalosphaeraceae bacterium]|nr:chemotaxis response regulator protein-glutamate methylesterase [Anaerohalosphaeraceae bacterium]HOT72371.1 chemotaxis response regulator protein-glutamate methylesterase [Anaerohalosphaeraceae bacterium]HQG05878.1 chemotaxis response regulator protein-glutamate methylesterase [Anaerohalosphaeraceae bacterium]HQI07160.1 chemotaxis response regulator protein-glutamate methylesterase [Anaerohalosphaeraceae bacterium]HQJ67395.1 chemotaxis response regulator protein-glutamate methylesterase [Anae
MLAAEQKTTKVLIVDDSAIVRKILSKQLDAHPSIEVIATAPDPYIARDKIVTLNPDVLILDVEMPRMDGVTFLKKLMKYHPMPVIIFSSLTPQGSKTAVEALASGAVEVLAKPGPSYSVGDACKQLCQTILAIPKGSFPKPVSAPAAPAAPAESAHLLETTHKIIAIGASTGGVQALTCVLSSLPADSPGTLVVQHMPAQFTRSFAERLNETCAVQVKEAADGDHIIPGRVLIAPGGYHMVLQRSGASYYVAIKDGPAVCHQKPSVEVLFNSVAKYAGANAVGAILTGMGNDGAKGLLALKEAGAHTIAQDEATCVVFGMPREAIRLNAAEAIVPLEKISAALIQFARS